MSIDLMLKPSCGGCGSTVELYGSTCKHLTLCVNCGKTMAENRAKCYECGTPITRLIREHYVLACPSDDRNYFIARFATGLPNFKKKNENKCTMQKEGLQGRQVSDTLRDVKPVKEEPGSSAKSSVPSKGAPPPQPSSKSAPAPQPTGPVTEEEIRAVLMQKKPVTTQDLVAKFKSRLKLKEDKDAFAAILRRISKIQKTNGANYVVLRER